MYFMEETNGQKTLEFSVRLNSSEIVKSYPYILAYNSPVPIATCDRLPMNILMLDPNVVQYIDYSLWREPQFKEAFLHYLSEEYPGWRWSSLIELFEHATVEWCDKISCTIHAYKDEATNLYSEYLAVEDKSNLH